MGLIGVEPVGLAGAATVLRSQADIVDQCATTARTALALADLRSPVLLSLSERADHFRQVAIELEERSLIVAQHTIDPGSVDPALLAAATTVGLDSINTIAELSSWIATWNGTDNDPLLDAMVNERRNLISTLFGGEATDAFVAAVAQTNGLSYAEAQFVISLHRVEELTAQMAEQTGPRHDGHWGWLSAERQALLNELLEDDQLLVNAVEAELGRGSDLLEAITPAVDAVYGSVPIVDLQDALARHGAKDSFGLALPDIAGLHMNAVEDFTGVQYDLVNPMVAGIAETEGHAYNALVEQYNTAIDAGELTGGRLAPIELNGTIPNDATLLWNLSQESLFEEMETARQGDRSRYDGKMSAEDLHAIVSSPATFSPAAVATAKMLLANDSLRGQIDTAGSHQFLDGLTDGTHSFRNTDGTISFGDVEQQITNSLVFGLLEQDIDQLDADADGAITKAEFEARLVAVDPSGGVAAAIEYALSDGAYSDRDQRSTLEKISEGLSTINSLNPMNPIFYHRLATDPTGLLGDYGSFAQGLLWEFPKGLAVLAYDASSLVPGSPAYLIETHTNWGGEEHRGTALLTGVAEVGKMGLTLVPGTPQFNDELEHVRRSGRWSDHQGIGMITTIADWESFVEDPAQWFGTITGDVLLTVATGGYGGLARGAGSLRRGLRMGTNLEDLRSIRRVAGTRLNTALANSRQLAVYTRTWLTEPIDLTSFTRTLEDLRYGAQLTLNLTLDNPQLAIAGADALPTPHRLNDLFDGGIVRMSMGDIPGSPPVWKVDNIAGGHGYDSHGLDELDLSQPEYRDLVEETIDEASHGGTRDRDGANWWYNEESKMFVIENQIPNSHGDYGTAFEVSRKDYELPSGEIVNEGID